MSQEELSLLRHEVTVLRRKCASLPDSTVLQNGQQQIAQQQLAQETEKVLKFIHSHAQFLCTAFLRSPN